MTNASSPLRGPGSNQHRDKPPVPPVPPAGDAAATVESGAFLSDPFGDAEDSAREVPKWMLGGDRAHPTVADRARHEQRTLEADATRASCEGDTVGIAIADHWASVYRDFAAHHADGIEQLLVRAHQHAHGSDGRIQPYPDMLEAAGVPVEHATPSDLVSGDLVVVQEPMSRADCVALVMARGRRGDNVDTVTLVAVTAEGFTSAFSNALRDLPEKVVRVSQ